MRRLLLLAALITGPMGADEASVSEVRARLSVRIKETLPLPPVVPATAEELETGEPVLVLEPMVVTAAMETDLLAEARRAAAARKEREFSLLRGGSLFSTKRMDIGFWAKLVPVDDTPVKKRGRGHPRGSPADQVVTGRIVECAADSYTRRDAGGEEQHPAGPAVNSGRASRPRRTAA